MDTVQPRKLLHTKRSFANAKHSTQLSVDSPLYDASEEDNTDDGSSIGTTTPWARNQNGPSSLIQGRFNPKSKGNAGAGGSSRLSHGHTVDTDSGVDSPTYDGDVETTTSRFIPPHNQSGSTPVRSGLAVSSLSVGGDSASSLLSANGPTETPASPISSTYPDPPSSAVSVGSGDELSSVEASSIERVAQRRSSGPVGPTPTVFLVPAPQQTKATPKASDAPLPHTTPDTTAPPDVETDDQQREGGDVLNTSMLSAEDIRDFVRKAIDGEVDRNYKINTPPEGRPIRIYADGVYDMFHFGHALQLRQAKLSFPSVHLLVGICSDALCIEHKARPVLSHFERLESARHCRWVDQVVPDAPWIIEPDFLERYQIDYVAHDEDPYAGSNGAEDIYKPIKDLGKFLPTRRTPGISTSQLLERLVVRYRLGDFDGKLEKIGHGELSARGSQYDDSRPASRLASRNVSPPHFLPITPVGE